MNPSVADWKADVMAAPPLYIGRASVVHSEFVVANTGVDSDGIIPPHQRPASHGFLRPGSLLFMPSALCDAMPPDPARSARQHRAFHRLERQALEQESLAYAAWERDNAENIERWRMAAARRSRARHNAAYAAGAYPDARRARSYL